MRKLCVTIFAAILAITVSPAQAQDWEGDVPPGRSFVCDEGSNTSPFIQVVLNDEGATLMLESEAIPMDELPVASGFSYAATLPTGRFLVTGKGDEVQLAVDNQAPKACVENDDYNVDYVSLFDNFSLGGKVRMGPGIDYEQVGSLPYGAEITILMHTGSFMDGYEWFQIEWGNGNRGFQWGGIMCSKAAQIDGLYEDCPSDL